MVLDMYHGNHLPVRNTYSDTYIHSLCDHARDIGAYAGYTQEVDRNRSFCDACNARKEVTAQDWCR